MDEFATGSVDNQSTLLIVDDNPVNRQVLSAILKSRYRNLTVVENGQQCLDALTEQAFDLVLLDLNMPFLSGFEVLTQVNAMSFTYRPAFIVVSADNQSSTISQALQLGASDYVTAPFNPDELLARVGTHLSLHNREQELEARVRQRTAELETSNQELQTAQDQLILAEKMASLGGLSAGIAHEINNPIGYIHSNLDSLKGYLEDLIRLLGLYQQAEAYITDAGVRSQLQQLQQDINLPFLKSDVQQLIDDSLQGARQVKQIIADLKTFSHNPRSHEQGSHQWECLQINDCIQSVLNIVKSELKYKADVHLSLDKQLPAIQCIPTQIYQVMTNLLVNAAQAIEQHGDIYVETHSRVDRIEIVIRDTGSGIDSELIGRIFDPFFTTKGVGEGTGLGLYVTYRIIEGHQGTIQVNSEPGAGCQFSIQLPLQQLYP
ncbi:hybrid sensor histidine kinase/response regulator [Pseudomaricurvus sp.]|uniref:hybrid sensor histidine kinase/response regulator n=1 Tax=Pseudomaricurvus sp. TaxID=2004510 RepID=UPI003F6C65E2